MVLRFIVKKPRLEWSLRGAGSCCIAGDAGRNRPKRGADRRVVERDRLALVRRDDHVGFVRDHAEQRQPQDGVDVLDREHLAFLDERGAQPVDDQFGRPAVGQQPDDAVGVADGRDLGRADDDGVLRAGDRVAEAEFDSRRAIDQHVLEALAQLFDQVRHLFGIDVFFFRASRDAAEYRFWLRLSRTSASSSSTLPSITSSRW